MGMMRIRFTTFLIYILILILSTQLVAFLAEIGLIIWYPAMITLTVWFLKMDGNEPKNWFRDVSKGFIRGFALFPLTYLALLLVTLIFPLDTEDTINIDWNVFVVITALFLAPFGEEMMFRGYIQDFLKSRMRTELAIILSSIIFSLFHPFKIFPQVFVLAVILGTVKEHYNSLIPSVVIHSLNNFLALVVSFMK